jgi:excisionase family DNA binding protein
MKHTSETGVVPLVYCVEGAAEALRLSRSALYELIRSGELRSIKQGKRRLVPLSALADYVDRALGDSA